MDASEGLSTVSQRARLAKFACVKTLCNFSCIGNIVRWMYSDRVSTSVQKVSKRRAKLALHQPFETNALANGDVFGFFINWENQEIKIS